MSFLIRLDILTDLAFQRKTEYFWYKDDVQTARVLFYLRVTATCIEHLPSPVFVKVVAPTMFLYPFNEKCSIDVTTMFHEHV